MFEPADERAGMCKQDWVPPELDSSLGDSRGGLRSDIRGRQCWS